MTTLATLTTLTNLTRAIVHHRRRTVAHGTLGTHARFLVVDPTLYHMFLHILSDCHHSHAAPAHIVHRIAMSLHLSRVMVRVGLVAKGVYAQFARSGLVALSTATAGTGPRLLPPR